MGQGENKVFSSIYAQLEEISASTTTQAWSRRERAYTVPSLCTEGQLQQS